MARAWSDPWTPPSAPASGGEDQTYAQSTGLEAFAKGKEAPKGAEGEPKVEAAPVAPPNPFGIPRPDASGVTPPPTMANFGVSHPGLGGFLTTGAQPATGGVTGGPKPSVTQYNFPMGLGAAPQPGGPGRLGAMVRSGGGAQAQPGAAPVTAPPAPVPAAAAPPAAPTVAAAAAPAPAAPQAAVAAPPAVLPPAAAQAAPPVAQKSTETPAIASTTSLRKVDKAQPSQIDWSNMPKDNATFLKMLEDAGFTVGSKEWKQALTLYDKQIQLDKAVGAAPGEAGKSITHLGKKIGNLGKKIGVDPNSIGFAPPTAPQPGADTTYGTTPGSVDPTTGDVTLATTDPSSPIPDWLKNTDPATATAWFNYLAGQQGTENQQVGANVFKDFIDEMKSDPARAGLLNFLDTKAGTATLSPEIVEAMKTSGRETADASLRALDEQVRALAAQSGRPVSDFAPMIAEGRAKIANDLIASNRGIDIEAAKTAANDRAREYDYYANAPGSLYGFLQPAVGSMANLIAGQNLAGTLNGWAPSKLAQQQFEESQKSDNALHGADWVGLGANLVGSGLKAFLGA